MEGPARWRRPAPVLSRAGPASTNGGYLGRLVGSWGIGYVVDGVTSRQDEKPNLKEKFFEGLFYGSRGARKLSQATNHELFMIGLIIRYHYLSLRFYGQSTCLARRLLSTLHRHDAAFFWIQKRKCFNMPSSLEFLFSCSAASVCISNKHCVGPCTIHPLPDLASCIPIGISMTCRFAYKVSFPCNPPRLEQLPNRLWAKQMMEVQIRVSIR